MKLAPEKETAASKVKEISEGEKTNGTDTVDREGEPAVESQRKGSPSPVNAFDARQKGMQCIPPMVLDIVSSQMKKLKKKTIQERLLYSPTIHQCHSFLSFPSSFLHLCVVSCV